MTTPETCQSCKLQPVFKGHACRMCFAVELAISVISRDYAWTEYEGLIESIGDMTFTAWRDQGRTQGAYITASTGAMLVRIAWIGGKPEWEFKRVLFGRLRQAAIEYRGIEQQYGSLEAYRQRCAVFMGPIIERIAGRYDRNNELTTP